MKKITNKNTRIKKNTAGKKITLEKFFSLMEQGFAKAEKDNEDLAVRMEQGFAKAEKDNEDLAVMVRQGFEETDEKNDKRFIKLEQGFIKLDQGQKKLEQGQEDIKLHMSNIAYKIDIIDLQKRIQKVEDIVLRKKK